MARRFHQPVWLLSIAATGLLVAGCHREDVKVYRIAKDQDQPSQMQTTPALPTDSPNPGLPPGHPDISSLPAGAATAGNGNTQLTWKAPAGWVEQPASDMRVGSFKVTGANGKQVDVSIIPLPGMAGTDSANVNRWRGQVGQSTLTDEDLQKSAESVVAGGQPAQLYDLAGSNPGSGDKERIIGVIQHRDGMTWFYKMTGDADLAEQQKPAFVEFLKSLNFGAAAPAQPEMPAGHPAVGGDMTALLSAPAAPISHDGQPNWTVPAGWKEVAGGQFLVAKFTIAGNGTATAAVNVSSSPGDGGGLAANVNRWRGQLGLPPATDIPTTPLDVTGGKAQLVDISGTSAQTSQPTRLIGAIVSINGQTWFYKLMGDSGVVEGQKAAFLQFVQGAKY